MIAKTETHRRQFGITLLELMIAVAIVGILAAIAYPSYVEYVKRSNRADAMQALQQGAQQAERWFTQQNSYVGLTDVFAFAGESTVEGDIYDLSVGTPTAVTFTLTATPKAGTVNAGDGAITINQDGTKLWNGKGWNER
ncbi:type IV pilin protein [Panacagrimonas sp.]|uniref:type IV pilin protein n=1 Tax=Panacagrimonas sp. TaxID=2480088 RepID=UPI003B53037D